MHVKGRLALRFQSATSRKIVGLLQKFIVEISGLACLSEVNEAIPRS